MSLHDVATNRRAFDRASRGFAPHRRPRRYQTRPAPCERLPCSVCFVRFCAGTTKRPARSVSRDDDTTANTPSDSGDAEHLGLVSPARAQSDAWTPLLKTHLQPRHSAHTTLHPGLPAVAGAGVLRSMDANSPPPRPDAGALPRRPARPTQRGHHRHGRRSPYLMQCADSVIRLHAEFLWAKGASARRRIVSPAVTRPAGRTGSLASECMRGIASDVPGTARAREHTSYRRWLDRSSPMRAPCPHAMQPHPGRVSGESSMRRRARRARCDRPRRGEECRGRTAGTPRTGLYARRGHPSALAAGG